MTDRDPGERQILLTGSSGQIGFELKRTLQPLGKVVDCPRSRCDFRDTVSLDRLIRAINPAVIVNAAGYTAVDRAESEPELAMQVNAVAPRAIANAAASIGALMVQYSTDYVFDGANADPYTEADTPKPLNTYGRSQLAGEEQIASSGCDHLIFRTSWVYGTRGRNFLQNILRLAAEKRDLRIVADQIGAPTWCRRIAEATAHVLGQVLDSTVAGSARRRTVSGVYHLAAAGATSRYEFARAIFASTADGSDPPQIVPMSTAEYHSPARRPLNSRLDCTKIYESFGVRLPLWEADLRRVLNGSAERVN